MKNESKSNIRRYITYITNLEEYDIDGVFLKKGEVREHDYRRPIPDGWRKSTPSEVLDARGMKKPSELSIIPRNDEYLDMEIMCRTCGKFYRPNSDMNSKISLNIPPILANNFCSRRCYNDHDSFELNYGTDSLPVSYSIKNLPIASDPESEVEPIRHKK